MPSPALCACPKPRFRLDEGVSRCFYCGKLQAVAAEPLEPAQAAAGAKRPSSKSKPDRGQVEQKQTTLTFDLHSEPSKIADEIDAVRKVLKIDGDKVEIPERSRKFYFPEEWTKTVAARIQEKCQDLENADEATRSTARWEAEQELSQTFYFAWVDSAKSALSLLGSSPESLEFHSERGGLDIEDHLKTLNLYMLVAGQADRLRRKYGLSHLWPAEAAILYGPRYAPPPFIGELRKRLLKESIQTQLGKLLFDSIPLPLDDHRQVQYFRDEWNALIEQEIKRRRSDRKRPWVGRMYHQQDDGTVKEIPREQEDLHLYQVFQDSMPEYLRQPVSNTPIPERVIDQRFRDAKQRRERYGPSPMIIHVPKRGHGQEPNRAARRKAKK